MFARVFRRRNRLAIAPCERGISWSFTNKHVTPGGFGRRPKRRRRDVVYRNGEPGKIFVNSNGLAIYEYQNGKTITNDDATTAYYYFKGSELYATKGVLDIGAEWGRYDDLIAWYGQSASEMIIQPEIYHEGALRVQAQGHKAD